MNNIQPSMFQQHQKNKDNVIDFVPFLEQKNHATTVIRNIAQTIFEQFGCGSLFNDDCIKNFGVISNPANFKITLLNFQPTKSIFAFLSSIRRGHFLSVSNECTFSTDGFGRLFDIKVSYILVERINSGFIGNKIFISFDSHFDISEIRYQRINERRELLDSISKTKDMLCSLDHETLFLELFMNDNNLDLKELFPAFFEYGPHVFNADEIEANSTLARMLLI